MFGPFTVEPYLAGVRIDSYLAKVFRNHNPARIQRAVAAGWVRVDGLAAERDTRVQAGQSVVVHRLEPPDHLLPPDAGELAVIDEDPWLCVVDKPAGMIAHPVGKWDAGAVVPAGDGQ